MVVIIPQYLLNLVLWGYFSSFVSPLAALFFQPGNIVMKVISFLFAFSSAIF